MRSMRPADLTDVLRIEQASFPDAWPADAFDHWLSNGGSGHVLERSGRCVGFFDGLVPPSSRREPTPPLDTNAQVPPFSVRNRPPVGRNEGRGYAKESLWTRLAEHADPKSKNSAKKFSKPISPKAT